MLIVVRDVSVDACGGQSLSVDAYGGQGLHMQMLIS